MYSMLCSTGELDQYVRDRLGALRALGALLVVSPSRCRSLVSSLSSSPLVEEMSGLFALV